MWLFWLREIETHYSQGDGMTSSQKQPTLNAASVFYLKTAYSSLDNSAWEQLLIRLKPGLMVPC